VLKRVRITGLPPPSTAPVCSTASK
jgi:hypothetical protein